MPFVFDFEHLYIIACLIFSSQDMTSPNLYEAGLAISCLSNICTPDLARDLAADVVTMLNSARPYLRKKSCLVLYKIFLKFPDALRPSFPRLKEKLDDPDPGEKSKTIERTNINFFCIFVINFFYSCSSSCCECHL